MELLLMLDAARGASAAQITAVIPHYAYARSDKKDASRISIGGRLVADLLVTAGASRVLTMTLHAPQVHGFFSVPVDHLTALGVLAEHFRGHGPRQRRRRLARPRQRQDRDPVRAAARAAGRGRQQAAAGRRPGGDRRDRRRRRGQARDRARRRDRHRRLDRRAAGQAARAGLHGAAVACTHGLFTGKAIERLRGHPMITEIVTTDTVPAPRRLARTRGPLGGRAVRRGDRADPRGRVGQQPLRRRGPGARPAAAAAVRRVGVWCSGEPVPVGLTPPGPYGGRVVGGPAHLAGWCFASRMEGMQMFYEVMHAVVPPVARGRLAAHGRGARERARHGRVILASNHL